MTLRTWISNLAHRIVGMEADSVNPHVLAAFTDIQWALRELASREEGAQDADLAQAVRSVSWHGEGNGRVSLFSDDWDKLRAIACGVRLTAEKPQPMTEGLQRLVKNMDDTINGDYPVLAEVRAIAHLVRELAKREMLARPSGEVAK